MQFYHHRDFAEAVYKEWMTKFVPALEKALNPETGYDPDGISSLDWYLGYYGTDAQINESRWNGSGFTEKLEKIRRMPNSTITMEKFKRAWYEGNDGSSEHYNWTRYYALNLHAVFSKGTLEWRCFESTLHAGKVRSNITLALAISAQAINQSCTHAKKTEIGDNPAFTFRTFLLRLGLIGDEYKNVRKHLLANLDGDKAWRYDKSTYACLQNPRRTDDAR